MAPRWKTVTVLEQKKVLQDYDGLPMMSQHDAAKALTTCHRLSSDVFWEFGRSFKWKQETGSEFNLVIFLQLMWPLLSGSVL